MSHSFRLRLADNRGASLVEMAIVIPLVLVLLLGIFEFARIIVLKNILATTVSRTASLAAVVPDLEAYPDPGSTSDTEAVDAERAAAIANLRASAKQLPLSTLFGAPGSDAMAVLIEKDQSSTKASNPASYPGDLATKDPLEVILPQPKPGQTLKEAMREQPITLRMHARIDSILPFLGPFEVTSSTAIFREPKTYSSLPIALDCKGNRLTLGSKPECPCVADPENPTLVYDYATGSCRCAGDLVGDGRSCGCPGNLSQVPGTAKCVCNLVCEGNDILDAASCTCKKAPCGIHEEQIPNTANCRCAPETCGIHERQDPTTCECIACMNLEVRGADPSTCSCEPSIVAPECTKTPDTYLDTATCTCKTCPAGKTADASGTGCICKSAATCTTETKFVKESTCECVTCPQGWVVNETRTVCKCRGDYSYQSTYDNLCHCNLADGVSQCTALGKTLNPLTCSCEDCPPNMDVKKLSSYQTTCACKTALVNACTASKGSINPYTCQCSSCPAGYKSDATASKCICENVAACKAAGKGTDPTTCQCIACPGSTVPDNNGNCYCNIWGDEEWDPAYDWCQPQGLVWNGATCRCETCQAPQIPQYGYSCACPSGTPTQAQCVDKGMTLNYKTCSCESCPAPKIIAQSGCVCDPRGPQPGTCTENKAFNAVTCSCEECPAGRYANPDHTACISCGKTCANGERLDIPTCTCVPCPAGMISNSRRTGCICDPTMHQACYYDAVYETDDCICDYYCSGDEYYYSPMVPNADRSACICPASVKETCTASWAYYDPNWCECNGCGWGRVASPDHLSCTCPASVKTNCVSPTSYFDPVDCYCRPCDYLKVSNADHSACVCPENAASKCSASQKFNAEYCRCETCPSTQESNADHTACVCKASGAQNCSNTQKYNTTNCTCEYCPYSQNSDDTRSFCYCDQSKKASCGATSYWDPTNCACYWCGSNKVHTPDYLSCVCDLTKAGTCAPNAYFDTTSCSCKACGTLKVSASDKLSCVCPDNASSKCAANQKFDPATCSCVNCPAYHVPTADKSSCVCSVSSVANTCAVGKVVNSSTCTCDITCVAPRTPNTAKTECVCPTCPTNLPLLNPSTCECTAACSTGIVTSTGACCRAGSIILNDRCADAQCGVEGTQCSLDPVSGTYTVSEE